MGHISSRDTPTELRASLGVSLPTLVDVSSASEDRGRGLKNTGICFLLPESERTAAEREERRRERRRNHQGLNAYVPMWMASDCAAAANAAQSEM